MAYRKLDKRMFAIKVRRAGNSRVIVLPKEELARLHVTKSGRLLLIESDSGYQLTSYGPEFRRQMVIAENRRRRFCKCLAGTREIIV
ncbi:MAG: AbrB/MazE/SpoVT family DNA-binding domain-containing protein [Candidatus Binataceae bacterium]